MMKRGFVGIVLVLLAMTLLLPVNKSVAQLTVYPSVVTVISVEDGRTWALGTVTLTDPNGVPYDAATMYHAGDGTLGPLVIDLPQPDPPNPPTGQTEQHTYVITIVWEGDFTPHVVGGCADIESWVVGELGSGVLTITAKSVMRHIVVEGVGEWDRWIVAFMVFFSSGKAGYEVTSGLSMADGMMVCFEAEDFNMMEGAEPGELVAIVKGYYGQVSGFVKIFMPESVPAQFGRTLDDVVITVDGSTVAEPTVTDNPHIVFKEGDWLPGRLWEFPVTFSEKEIKSDLTRQHRHLSVAS